MTFPSHPTVDDWIARDAIPFSLTSPDSFHAAVDRLLTVLGPSVELLGIGEAMHGGEEFLVLRNRLFQHLVGAHGYSAIALESSFPRGRVANDYVQGRGPTTFAELETRGFSHGFGRLEANRELVEWMRQYNANPATRLRVQFYGFDSPTEMAGADSPRQLLHIALDYLASFDAAAVKERRKHIDDLLGHEAAWANPGATFDPAKSIGQSPAAVALRGETEDLLSELHVRRPELVTAGGELRYLDAVHHARIARQMLNYHAALARPAPDRLSTLLGIRDGIMGDNLAHIVAQERARGGKVLAFAHNSHLQAGQSHWQFGSMACTWWPGGAHARALLGARYAAIGVGVGTSEPNGVAQPEPGTLEARLTAAPGPIRFLPTHQGRSLPATELAALPARSSGRNPSYFPFTAQSLAHFDALAVFDSVTYNRGGPKHP